MTYARFFPSDWRSGCFCLNLEEEGLYIRFCAYMYDTGMALPDDERTTSRLLNVHPLQYRKVMASLIMKGKIVRAQGYLINERAQDELDRYRREQAARRRSAQEREERRRQFEKEITEAVATKTGKGTNLPVDPRVNPQVNPRVNPRIMSGVTQEIPPSRSQIYSMKSTALGPQLWHSRATTLLHNQNPWSRSQIKKKRK
jgi:uncharacterized protein YdaU (DUF1376 family)